MRRALKVSFLAYVLSSSLFAHNTSNISVEECKNNYDLYKQTFNRVHSIFELGFHDENNEKHQNLLKKVELEIIEAKVSCFYNETISIILKREANMIHEYKRF